MITAKGALLDQLLISGSNFLVVVFVARFAGQDAVAKYAYAYGLFVLCSMIANAWLYQNVMAMDREALGKGGRVTAFAGLNLLLTSLFAPLSYVIFLVSIHDYSERLWLEAGLAALFVAVNQLIDFERRILYFVPHPRLGGPALVSGVGFMLRVPAVGLIRPACFSELMLIIVLSSLPGALLASRRLSLSVFRRGFMEFSRRQIGDGKWMTANVPINWTWGQAPVFIVGSMLGLQAAGIYSAVRGITNIANVAMEMIPTYFASKLSPLFTGGGRVAYKKYMLAAVATGVILWGLGLGVIILFGREILSRVFGADYSQYFMLLQLFWGFNIFVFLSRVQFLHLRFISKTIFAPISHLFGVLVLFSTFLIEFRDQGVQGLAWSMIAAGATIVSVQFVGISVCKARKKLPGLFGFRMQGGGQ